MDSNALMIRKSDLIENPTARVAICLVLDCSPSMGFGNEPLPIDALNEGVQHFFNSIKEDMVARYAAEVAIIGFSGVAEVLLDFQSLDRVDFPPTLQLETTHGGTSLGTALKLAMNKLEERKAEYKTVGVDYYQPWLVVMTDGEPTDDTHLDIQGDIYSLASQKKLSVFPIGVGSEANLDVLSALSPRQALSLKGLCFSEFFEWLSKSVSRTSQSTPGEEVPLDIDGIQSWGTL